MAPAASAGHHGAAMLTGLQIRAALAMLQWTHADLAKHSKISVPTIQRAASVDGVPDMRTHSLGSLRAALEKAGVVFLDAGDTKPGGQGARMKR